MNLSGAIYLTEVIGNLSECLAITFWVGFFVLLFCGIAYLICLGDYKDCDGHYKKAYSALLRKYWVLLLLLVINIPVPSKNSMYLMLGAKYLSTSELPAKVEKVLALKIDDYITELQNKTSKDKDNHDSTEMAK